MVAPTVGAALAVVPAPFPPVTVLGVVPALFPPVTGLAVVPAVLPPVIALPVVLAVFPLVTTSPVVPEVFPPVATVVPALTPVASVDAPAVPDGGFAAVAADAVVLTEPELAGV